MNPTPEVIETPWFKTSIDSLSVTAEPLSPTEPLEAPDLLTASRMECWNLCRRKHHYRYVMGYDASTPSQSLAFGTWWHKYMEYWWGGRRDPDEIRERIWTPAKFHLDSLALIYFEELCVGYNLAHIEEAEKYEVLEIEREFRGPLFDVTGPRNRTEVSAELMVGGKVDLILRRKADGEIGPGEHKTTKQTIETDAEPYWDKLVMDHQLSTYALGADWLGYNAEWALYDVVRKPSIRPDKRKGEKTDEDFRPRLRAAIAENLRSYFRWREIPRQHQELFHAANDLWETGRLIEIAKKGNLAPRNPAACFKFGTGNRCCFYDSCLGNVPLGENRDLVKKAPFSELEVPEED